MFDKSLKQIAKKTGVVWLLGIGAIFPSIPAQASDYQVISENTKSIDLFIGELWLTDTVVQDGPETINRFTMYRLRRPYVPHRGAILLLPSLGNNFDMYLFHEDGDITKSFAAFFARLGYDVWGYSPRTTGISAGDCAGGLDCSEVLDWGLQTVIDDVTFVRSEMELVSPGESPVIGGLSLGAMTAIAVVNEHPADYAGLLAWEGSLVTDDPATQAHNQVFCDQFTALVGAGVAVDDQSLPFVKLVAQLAQATPDDPFVIPVPGFPPSLTNHQAFVFILSTPNPIAPSPRSGFITAAGDVFADELTFSDEDRLFANIAVFNDVTSNRVGRDFYCSLAGVETSYTSNLASFTAPTLIIRAGQGFGPIMDELPGKLGSTSIEFLSNDDYAHVDHLGTPAHLFVLELPIAQWLNNEVFD
jgi:pimeloyl-ACP methyl ester carboxylesterase